MPAEYFYPDSEKPYLRMPIGGITYVDQENRRRELQKGLEVQLQTVQSVIEELKALGTKRALDLILWIELEFKTESQ